MSHVIDLELDLGAEIAVLSDLQRTARVERLLFREQNDEERERLIEILVATRPRAVLLLGDLVFCGSSRRGWAYFDRLTKTFSRSGIELLPILGNHDCWSLGDTASNHFFARFPRLERRRFYTARLGPLGIVALDSNRSWMPRAAWDEQSVFYDRALADFDADPKVRGVLVLVHHPPFTNGIVTGPSTLVSRSFVPSYVRAKKTLLMLSGHAHTYEHFSRDDRHFVVCGGGGGPRHLLRKPGERVFPDLFDGPPLRDFHFLGLRPEADALDVRVTGLAKGAQEARPMDVFRLVWPG